jgi:hypothetical protein
MSDKEYKTRIPKEYFKEYLCLGGNGMKIYIKDLMYFR